MSGVTLATLPVCALSAASDRRETTAEPVSCAAASEQAHGSANLENPTASTKLITEAILGIFDKVADKGLLVRRITVCANGIEYEAELNARPHAQQMSLFYDAAAESEKQAELARERRAQRAMLAIKKKFGKNAILKGMNLKDGATARERNHQIGGHRE